MNYDEVIDWINIWYLVLLLYKNQRGYAKDAEEQNWKEVIKDLDEGKVKK